MKKHVLTIASFLMIIVGLLRGMGGLALLTDRENLDTGLPLTASPGEADAAAYSLLAVCFLLVLSGLLLTIRRVRFTWLLSWVSILLFLIGGAVNGFLLFGHPLSSGQGINLGICCVIGACLFIGKERIRN